MNKISYNRINKQVTYIDKLIILEYKKKVIIYNI